MTLDLSYFAPVNDLANTFLEDAAGERGLIQVVTPDGLPILSALKFSREDTELQISGPWAGLRYIDNDPDSIYQLLMATVMAYSAHSRTGWAMEDMRALRVTRSLP